GIGQTRDATMGDGIAVPSKLLTRPVILASGRRRDATITCQLRSTIFTREPNLTPTGHRHDDPTGDDDAGMESPWGPARSIAKRCGGRGGGMGAEPPL